MSANSIHTQQRQIASKDLAKYFVPSFTVNPPGVGLLEPTLFGQTSVVLSGWELYPTQAPSSLQNVAARLAESLRSPVPSGEAPVVFIVAGEEELKFDLTESFSLSESCYLLASPLHDLLESRLANIVESFGASVHRADCNAPSAAEADRDEAVVQRTKNQQVIRLLDEWLEDDSGYDEKAWPKLKKSIEKHRLGKRRRFSD